MRGTDVAEEEPQGIQVHDKRGKSYQPPDQQAKVDTSTLSAADQMILAQQAAQAEAEDAERAEQTEEYPPDTVFVETAYLMILLPDGTWVADSAFDRNIAVKREPHNTDFLGSCAALSAMVMADMASTHAAGKVIASLQGIGQKMAATRTADAAQVGAASQDGMNRAQRRRG